MQRQEWVFSYTVEKVLEAAKIKHSYHAGRLGFWLDKNRDIRELIKNEGLEFDESVSDIVSSNYRDPQVTVRNDLLNAMRETQAKIREHRNKVNEYNGWVTVLTAQLSTASLSLNHDDWLFFFSP